ncbi:MAG TPA: TonB-dependent receptor [Polyangiaceae bacterium]|nr:TonB-dependent receptor [Polyangiaceae bacterium]
MLQLLLAAVVSGTSLVARRAFAETTTKAETTAEDPDLEEEFGATARVEAPPREVTKRTLEAKELTRVPGTFGDALRAVEVLPGVTLPPNAQQPLIRGSNFQDSQVFFDGAPVPILYHFGNFKSFVNSRLLERVDFYPGNFSTRYGRATGGVIEVRPRDPRQDRWGGVVDVSLLDSSAIVEGPVGSRASMGMAARRSNIDLVFKSLAGSADFNTVAAPLYYDYQYIASIRPTDRDRVRVMMYGSSDRVELVFAKPADDDPAIRGQFAIGTQFHRIQSSWRRQLSGAASQDIQITAGSSKFDVVLGPNSQQRIGVIDIGGRAEWTFALSSRVRAVAGLDVKNEFYRGTYTGPQPTDGEGTLETKFGTQRTVSAVAHLTVAQPAAYVELGVRPFDALLVTPGVRVDWFSNLGRVAVDPRLSARYEVSRRLAFKAGVGSFSQPPEPWQAAASFSNPNLAPMRAIQTSAGFDYRFTDTISVGVEGFYKRLEDRVVDTVGGAHPRYVNDGAGRVWGAELLARVAPRDRVSGLVSYTISRSERSDHGGAYRLFAYDQTHVVAASCGVALGRGWELGGTFRLMSGRPLTAIAGRTYDATSDLYIPRSGPLYAERSPVFHRLDVRLEKKWTFSSFSLATYLDVQNVYNQQSVEGRRYNYDYTKSEVVAGLPVLPSLGLRGEL